jgi:serine/threonine protein kinase
VKSKVKFPLNSIGQHFKDYDIGGLISGGGFGSVYVARYNNRKDFPTYCVIKRMFYSKIKEKSLVETVERELKLLRRLDGVPGCLSLIDIV